MKKVNLVLVILIGAVVLGVVTRMNFTRSMQNKKTAYTVVLQATEYDASGKGTPVYTETRYASANGNWYSIRLYADGRNDETFALIGRGVYAKVGSKLNFLSDYDAPTPMMSLEKLQKSPNYVRTETVLGQEAAVLKTGDPNNVIELYRAPSLGGDIIKMVRHAGSETVTVLEPLSLTFGEPDASLLKMPNLPVDRTHFEELHGNGKGSATEK
jgi:hypothetical protein